MDPVVVSELVEFLSDARPEVRKVVADNVLGLTASEEGRRLLVRAGAGRPLVRLIGDLASVAEPALKSLVNLSGEEGFQEQMLSLRVVSRLMELILGQDCAYRRTAVMLLSNLCQTTGGCLQLMQRDEGIKDLEGLHLRRLVHGFVAPLAREEDPFEFAALVLQNVAQLEEARALLADPERDMVGAMLPQLRSRSLVRRRGVSGLLKNLCFEPSFAACLARGTPFGGRDVLIELVRPLAGPEPVSADRRAGMPSAWLELGSAKKRESDPVVRRNLLEALLLAATRSRAVRDRLRALRVYEVVRRLHIWLEGADMDLALSAPHPLMRPKDAAGDGDAAADLTGPAQRAAASERVARRTAEEEYAILAAGLVPTVAPEGEGDGEGRGFEADEDGDGDGAPPLPIDDETSVRCIQELVQLIHGDEAHTPSGESGALSLEDGASASASEGAGAATGGSAALRGAPLLGASVATGLEDVE